jgi:serine/threonine protein kinase
MGVVYLAQDPRRALPVAVKLVRPELASDSNYQERFRREIGMAFRVAGPYTARVLAADLDADEPYFVTEYVDGPTLTERVREHGSIAGSELRDFAIGMASGLISIHSVGLVHRDLKPGNVLLTEGGPKLIDFGIAADPTAFSLTRPGETVGTPGWLAPEQARGQKVGPATDVFAWGALVAFSGTGREPFGPGPAEAVLYRVVHEDPDLDGLDDALRPLVAQALSKTPSERPTAEQLHRQLLAPPDADTTQRAAASGVAATSRLAAGEAVRPGPSFWHHYGGWAVGAAIALVIVTGVTIATVSLSQSGKSRARPKWLQRAGSHRTWWTHRLANPQVSGCSHDSGYSLDATTRDS